MVKTERRPFGVTFTVGWGLVLAGMLVARAAGQTVVPAVLPDVVLSGLVLTATQGTLAFLLVVTSLLVFKLVSWSRKLGMLAFVLAGLVTATTLMGGSLFGFVVVALDGASVFMLLMNAEAFRNDRPEIDDSGSAAHFGAP